VQKVISRSLVNAFVVIICVRWELWTNYSTTIFLRSKYTFHTCYWRLL